jgi:hypothetical protein
MSAALIMGASAITPELYVFLTADGNILRIRNQDNVFAPLVVTKRSDAAKLLAVARQVAGQTGQPVRVVSYQPGEVIWDVKP